LNFGKIYNLFWDRTVAESEDKEINELKIKNFGSHSNSYLDDVHGYLTAASTIGMKKNDVDLFIKRLDSVLKSATSGIKTTDQAIL
jgi:hypothetical protein